MTDFDFDVIVVGSGAAGLCAALESSAGGASVLVVESEDVIGGASRLSGGQMMGAGSRLQKAHGIEDDPDAFFRHYMALNQWALEPGLVRRLVDEAAASIDWLCDLGVSFIDHIYRCGDETPPRMHAPLDDGAGVITVLLSAATSRANVEFARRRRVDRLVVDHGRVVGVAVGDDEVTGRAVVICTGGFGADREQLARHFPSALERGGDWLWYIGDPAAAGSRGDALRFTEPVGAQIVGHDRGQMMLNPNFGKVLEVYLPGWLVIVNGQADRFFDETAPYSCTEVIVRRQPPPLFAIFDAAAKDAADPALAGGMKRQESPGPLVKNWVRPVLDQKIEEGVVRGADTIEGLATEIGLDPDRLRVTIDAYNAEVSAGRDRMFLKNPQLMSRVERPPFYATEVRLWQLGLTAAGLRIDDDARVIDTDHRVVPGLFAAGECTGGVIGDMYAGSGNSFTNCVVFGRIAGRAAAEVVRGRGRP